MTANTQPEPEAALRVPLWKNISLDLGERLANGEFAGGFPGELVLAKRYGVSRGTVRSALRPLRENGAVTAERGRNQRVVDSGRGSIFGPLDSLFASVQAAGMTQRSTVLTQVITTDARAAALLGLGAETPLFHLARVRLADGEPLGRDEVWLPGKLAGPLLRVDFANTALYKELRDRCGIALDGGHEEVQAKIADELDIEYLGCEVGEPILAILRIGMFKGGPLEVRRSRIRGRRYAVTTRFGPIAEDD